MKIDEKVYEDLPLVTIITPSYNQGKFIKETIESVLNQDYPKIEYWVIDGGSTDETIDILKSYAGKLNWISEKDEGQADAVNKGIMLARGSIIGWLNSDDLYMEGSITHVVEFMIEHPKADMVYGEGYFINQNSNIVDRYNTERFSKKRLAETCIICQPTAFFTDRIVKKVKLLDKNLQLCMDYELWMKIAQYGCIMYTSKYLAASRMYDENKTLSRKLEVIEEVCNTIYKYYGYVPFIWVYSYALHKNKGVKNLKLILLLIKYYLEFSRSNMLCFFKEIINILMSKGILSHLYTGKYYDEWISQKYKVKLKTKSPSDRIMIIGNHVAPISCDLEILINIDGSRVGKFKLDSLGEFKKIVNIGKYAIKGRHKITLTSSQSYCPKDAHIIADKRQLTFKLYTLVFVEKL